MVVFMIISDIDILDEIEKKVNRIDQLLNLFENISNNLSKGFNLKFSDVNEEWINKLDLEHAIFIKTNYLKHAPYKNDHNIVLEKIAELITQEEDYRNKHIRIEVHTDNRPTDPDGPWLSNWHLSSARALNVLGYLVDFGADPERMSIVGYGEFKPIFENDTEEGRSKNRRVDIVILREK